MRIQGLLLAFGVPCALLFVYHIYSLLLSFVDQTVHWLWHMVLSLYYPLLSSVDRIVHWLGHMALSPHHCLLLSIVDQTVHWCWVHP